MALNYQADILIVGGGLIGALLHLKLTKLGFVTYLVDENFFSNRVADDFDARSFALAPASRQILMGLGVWHSLKDKATEINSIHVSAKNCFGAIKLKQDENSLGCIVEVQHINQALNELLPQKNYLSSAKLVKLDLVNNIATIESDSAIQIQAKLIIAADGTNSTVRKLCSLQTNIKDFNQQAIVANIGLQRSHYNTAYERFTPNGPLALLPLTNNRAALVWVMPPDVAKTMVQCEDKVFLKELQKMFGYKLGRLVKIGKRSCFPLKQVTATEQIYKSIVFVGNAANTLHPIAGQGFNLGLRDVAMLIQCIAKYGTNPQALQDYQILREKDQKSIIKLTNNLLNIFEFKLPGFNFLRSLGLVTFANIPLLQNSLKRYTSGYGGVVSDLVCGIPLDY